MSVSHLRALLRQRKMQYISKFDYRVRNAKLYANHQHLLSQYANHKDECYFVNNSKSPFCLLRLLSSGRQ